MSRNSLKTKLLWPLVSIGLAISLIGGWVIHSTITKEMVRHLQQQEKNLITAISVAAESTNSLQGLQRHVMALGAEPYVKLILVASASEGNIVASTRRAWIGRSVNALPEQAPRDDLLNILGTKKPEIPLGHEDDHGETGQHHYVSPILIRNPKLGHGQLDRAAIFVAVDTSRFDHLLTRELGFMAAWLMLLVLSLALLLWHLTNKLILKPSREIISTMECRTRGNCTTHAVVQSNDELQTLAETLNDMLDANDAAKREVLEVGDALAASETRYAGIVSNAMDAIIVVNDRQEIVLFNEAAEKAFGHKLDDILQQPLELLIPERYRREHRLHMQHYIDMGGTGRRMGALGEVYGLRHDGSEFPVEASISRTRVGERYFLTAILRDITNRKEAEQALRQAHNELEERVESRTTELSQTNRELQQHIVQRQAIEEALRLSESRLTEAQRIAHVGNWELDIVKQKLHWSDEIFRMFEIDKTRHIPTYEAFLDAIHPNDRDRVNQTYLDSLEKQTPYEITHRLLMKDGRVKHVHERCETFFNDQGEPLRSFGTVQDVTDRIEAMQALQNSEQQLKALNENLEERVEQRTIDLKLAKEEAEKASRAKSEFLSRISHELRTPMNAILGFSQLLGHESLEVRQQAFVGEISAAGSHLLELIEELLDLSRIESGKMAVAVTSVRLKGVLDEATHLVEPLLQAHKLHLDRRFEQSEHTQVLTDATRLRQILINLLSNAIKYNHENGHVQVFTEPAGEQSIRINIRDSGPGIAADQQERIFLPFERIGAEATNIEGAGIGLALSQHLAKLMGACIGVDSTPGEGSTFWLELPLSESAVQQTQDEAGGPVEAGQASVLYIEDNPANLRFIEAAFRHFRDTTLITANNGQYGIELAARYRPDLILLDINLPDMDGYQVLKRLRAQAQSQDIPVIAVSADAMPHDIERGMQAGFKAYLSKPVDLEVLQQTIQNTLTNN